MIFRDYNKSLLTLAYYESKFISFFFPIKFKGTDNDKLRFMEFTKTIMVISMDGMDGVSIYSLLPFELQWNVRLYYISQGNLSFISFPLV